MKSIQLITASLILLFCNADVNGQKTGNFSDVVTFQSANRSIAAHVPTNYNPSNAYRLMVGLHGLGDSDVNYRNYLINSLNWPSIFPNTIFLFPDGGSDNLKDFYGPAGDEEVIEAVIQYAKANYNIDTTDVILQGFSLGGRSALKYGLDHTHKFKGLLLNTPAIQGRNDAINVPDAGIIYDYAQAANISIYVSYGQKDDLYVGSIFKMTQLLKMNDAKLHVDEVNGLGHSIAGSAFIAPAIPFFYNTPAAPYDLDVFQIDLERRTCNSQSTATCWVRNKGNQVITSFNLNYTIDNVTKTYTWTGTLDTFQHAQVVLPALSLNDGEQNVVVEVAAINTVHNDTVTVDNLLEADIEMVSQGQALPLFEGMEGGMDGWVAEETGTLFRWYDDDEVAKDGNVSMANFGTILLFNTTGNEENFMSPVVDLTGVNAPGITFDVAFNYHEYTPPYFNQTTVFADTLEVLISTDCGETYERLYKKGGADLATAASPISNPLNVQQAFFTPTDDEWRKEGIDLADYANATEAIVRFNYISAMGGSIYIDNINMGDNIVGIDEKQTAIAHNVYPNPANDHINIQLDYDGAVTLHLFDAMGRQVLVDQYYSAKQVNQSISLDRVNTGMYFLEIVADGQRLAYEKVLVRK